MLQTGVLQIYKTKAKRQSFFRLFFYILFCVYMTINILLVLFGPNRFLLKILLNKLNTKKSIDQLFHPIQTIHKIFLMISKNSPNFSDISTTYTNKKRLHCKLYHINCQNLKTNQDNTLLPKQMFSSSLSQYHIFSHSRIFH